MTPDPMTPERLQDVTLAEIVAEMRQWKSGRDCGPPPCVADWADRIEAAAALSVRDWQDIASAPKDGTQILVARTGEDIGMGPVEIVDWCVMENWHWEQVGDDLFRKVIDKPTEFWNGNGHRATHWMPLPEPPATPPSEG